MAVSLKNVPSEVANPIVLYLISDLINDLYEERTWLTVAELMETCLFHQDPLIRVVAAVSYFEISQERDRLIIILEQGTHERDSPSCVMWQQPRWPVVFPIIPVLWSSQPPSQIQEYVLPVWFRHLATHGPNVWQKYNIPDLL